MKLSFHPYKERPKRTLYATSALFLVRVAPGLRDRLELELLWASTSGTRTELASGLLLDLDTLAGLLTLHTMCQTWSYAWVSCPHHPPSTRRVRMERGGRFPPTQGESWEARTGWCGLIPPALGVHPSPPAPGHATGKAPPAVETKSSSLLPSLSHWMSDLKPSSPPSLSH